MRDNADFRVPEGTPTLARHLKARGYRTAAVVGSVILESGLGLAQGFDVYDEPRATPAEAGRAMQIGYSSILERPATQVTDAAMRAAARLRPPFFLWVHYYDPHYDYSPPRPWAQKFAGRLYDGEIAYMDAEIGRLLDAMTARGLLDRTLVAVIADHGESLGEHGEETHGLFLYDSTIRVPLILRMPGLIPAGTKMAGPVSGVDLAPTILDLLGLPPLAGAQGVSFAPAVRGHAADRGEGKPVPGIGSDPGNTEARDGTATRIEPGASGSASVRRAAVYSESLFAERLYGWAPLFALRDSARVFIEAPEPEIYDLSTDTRETHNLASSRPDELASWRKRLSDLQAGWTAPSPGAGRPMDAEQKERLASLGYLSGGAPGLARRTGADPKRFSRQNDAVLRTKWLISQGRAGEARALIDEVLKADPGNPAALALGGMLAFSRTQGAEGLPQLEAAARSAPGVYENQRNLASAYHAAGRFADAARAYRAAIAIRPFSGIDHFGLGNALFADADSKGAEREYREAIRLGYDTPSVHGALGLALARIGDTAGAEESLGIAVARDPSLAEAWQALGGLSEKKRDPRRARERYERALAAEPRNTGALFDHARICLDLSDAAPARADHEALERIRPGHPRNLYLKGRLLLESGDKEGAKRAIEASLAQAGADARLATLAKKALARIGGAPPAF